MGVKELRDAFNSVTGKEAKCIKALMETVDSGVQRLYFSGNYADGVPFVIQSNPVRPSGDLVIASRETAAALLKQTRAT